MVRNRYFFDPTAQLDAFFKPFARALGHIGIPIRTCRIKGVTRFQVFIFGAVKRFFQRNGIKQVFVRHVAARAETAAENHIVAMKRGFAGILFIGFDKFVQHAAPVECAVIAQQQRTVINHAARSISHAEAIAVGGQLGQF